jgi:hypothetical protein
MACLLIRLAYVFFSLAVLRQLFLPVPVAFSNARELLRPSCMMALAAFYIQKKFLSE